MWVFIYNEGKKAPSLPYSVVYLFDDYIVRVFAFLLGVGPRNGSQC
jgi:hypothetical protein